ncbi:MAG: DUF4384 domain-containing protein [Burkholderiaceae bacterium]
MNAVVRALASFAMLLSSVAAYAAEVAVTRPTDLRVDRYTDAASLKSLAAGTSVELLKTEAGWVQVRVGTQTGWIRATGLTGDAASVSALARIENGRSAFGNIVVAAGIRGMPKASKHALIVGVDGVALPDGRSPFWPGVAYDIESARMIARRLDVPNDNVDVVQGSDANRDGILAAIDRLDERLQAGDQVLVYFTGPGTATSDGGTCEAAWMARDGATLSAATLVARMKPALTAAGKVFVIADVGYPVDASDAARKAIALSAKRGCGAPDAELPLVAAITAIGVEPRNIAVLQSAPGPNQGIEQPRSGGRFTQALVDCFLGDAVDADRSASISIGELAGCANAAHAPAAVTGNAAYSPIFGVVADGAVAATSPRATIDAVYAQRDARLVVSLVATPPTLQIGHDDLGLVLTSSRAGFVYLVLLGSDGKSFYLLFPNDLDRDNHIAAGESLRLPRPNWRVQGQGPPGRDTVLALVAESARDLTPFAANKEGPFSVALTDAQGRAQLQWLLGRSGQADAERCVEAGKRRNLAAVGACSDAFGAAIVDVIER